MGGPVDTHLADLIGGLLDQLRENRRPQRQRPAALAELDAAQLHLIFTEDGQGVASTGPLQARNAISTARSSPSE